MPPQVSADACLVGFRCGEMLVAARLPHSGTPYIACLAGSEQSCTTGLLAMIGVVQPPNRGPMPHTQGRRTNVHATESH